MRATGITFITGYPGFIGKRLVEKLVGQGRRVSCLIEERFREAATKHARALPSGAVKLVAGDITQEGLAIEPKARASLQRTITDVYHLAAIYDLTVAHDVGERVNVQGTQNVLDFCASLKKLRRLNYVSTCYVSGDRRGMVFEEELDKGQGFKNHYEETKFRAEKLVRERASEIPASIFRPSIVVGDSVTGETDKFDGPYMTFAAIRQGLMILTPGRGEVPINLVPVDFVVDCLATIPGIDGTEGKTFHLADPDPVTVIEVCRLVSDRMGVPRPLGHYPPRLLKMVLAIKPISDLLGIPQETVVYFNHQVVYDCTNTVRALRATQVSCPPLKSYLNNLLRFYLDIK
ncbi:MAG: SDR family oxidoreductase [Acidobacteriota bacterium]